MRHWFHSPNEILCGSPYSGISYNLRYDKLSYIYLKITKGHYNLINISPLEFKKEKAACIFWRCSDNIKTSKYKGCTRTI